ncbi:CIC11C00000001182 [Sungouiella intermedia]|uniref:Small ribosomal subunit protein mS29 n=1 Tax=Sungouiella intermedia TaxID=45354 RepID=A0A1L0BKC6_9ASCO|nr:CIC11C00000001182 [[Candida] intermedia]
MLRFAVARTGVRQRVQVGSLASSLKYLSVSATVNAAAPAGKKKVKMGFKPKETKEKVKKSGMTHLKFEDAVRQLKFENLARDLNDLQLAELAADKLESILSTVVKFNGQTDKLLKELGSFKKAQHHELFRNHLSLVSDNTVAIRDQFLLKLDSASKDNRVCLLGEKGVGKSTLIAQAQALALSQHNGDVVLLHLDFPERIVEGSSDYILNRKMKKYQQPMFTKRWIKKLRAANEAVFKKMPLTRDISFVAKKVEHNLKKGENTVYDFILLNHDFGLVGPSTAFKFLVEELKAHSEKFPVLVSIDNFNALIAEAFTKYFHPNMVPIHFTQFEAGHFIEQLVSGELSFAKGGVLLAESKDLGECKTLRVGLKLQEHDPYDKRTQCDAVFADTMTKNGGVKPLFLKNLSKDQTRELLLFWDKSGVLQVRDYPTKEIYKSTEEMLQDKRARKVGEYVECVDPQAQLENLVQSSYMLSSGNPGSLLKINHLVF